MKAPWIRPLAWSLAAAAAVALAVMATERNREHACREQQWPPQASCTDPKALPAAQQAQQWQDRLRHNPGDTRGYAALASLAPDPAAGVAPAQVLAGAARIVPAAPPVLGLQAQTMLKAGRWSEAVAPLTLLAGRHADPQAAQALAALVSESARQPELGRALLNALAQQPNWLERTLRSMPALKLSLGPAVPLASEAARQEKLAPALGQFLMSRLKAEGLWLEAHAIWLALWRQPVDLLFNGDFEQTPVSQGFDWEWRQDDPGRAGAQIQLQGFGQRGQVLRVRLTGRPLDGPAVWQHILLPPGHYRLSGDYRSDHLRSEGGLVWVLRCADRDEEMARSPGLSSTGRQWQGFEMALTSDGRCLGAMLALQPAMALESRTGLRGEMLFDQLRLERVSAP